MHLRVPRNPVGRPFSEQPSEMLDDLATQWQHLAACRGEDSAYFFAPNYFEKRAEKNAREAVAKALCVRCPVREIVPGVRAGGP